MTINHRLFIPLIAMIFATVACVWNATPVEDPADDIIPPTITFNQPDEAANDNANTADEESADEEPITNNDIQNTNGGSTGNTTQNTANTPSNTSGGTTVVSPAVLPACVPRGDWSSTYIVVRGDTLASIARRANTTFQTLAQGNCLADPNTIEVGQVLRVPNAIAPATISIEGDGNYAISANNDIYVNGRATGLPNGATVKVQLVDAEGSIREERTVPVQPTNAGQSDISDWQTTFNVYNITQYPLSSVTYAPMSIVVFGYDGADRVLATAARNVIVRDGDNVQIIEPFVHITSATVGSAANRNVVVSGEGRGLFEGNIVVEIRDSNGALLKQQPTTMIADEVGGYGTWETVIIVGELSTLGTGTVTAYSTSPQDGSVFVEHSLPIAFDWNSTPSVVMDITWESWDVLITPDVNGRFPVRGAVIGGSNLPVVVHLLNAGGQIVSGSQRTVMTDAGGQWYIPDMTVSAATVGTYTLVASVDDGNGTVLGTDTANVTITENAGQPSQIMDGGTYEMNYPNGWFPGGDAGIITASSFPSNNQPPGAAWNAYHTTISGGLTEYGEGVTPESIAQEIEQQVNQGAVNAQFTSEPVTLDDGTQALMLSWVGGTGKQIHQIVMDTGQNYVILTAQGNWDVAEPLMMTLRAK